MDDTTIGVSSGATVLQLQGLSGELDEMRKLGKLKDVPTDVWNSKLDNLLANMPEFEKIDAGIVYDKLVKDFDDLGDVNKISRFDPNTKSIVKNVSGDVGKAGIVAAGISAGLQGATTGTVDTTEVAKEVASAIGGEVLEQILKTFASTTAQKIAAKAAATQSSKMVGKVALKAGAQGGAKLAAIGATAASGVGTVFAIFDFANMALDVIDVCGYNKAMYQKDIDGIRNSFLSSFKEAYHKYGIDFPYEVSPSLMKFDENGNIKMESFQEIKKYMDEYLELNNLYIDNLDYDKLAEVQKRKDSVKKRVRFVNLISGSVRSVAIPLTMVSTSTGSKFIFLLLMKKYKEQNAEREAFLNKYQTGNDIKDMIRRIVGSKYIYVAIVILLGLAIFLERRISYTILSGIVIFGIVAYIILEFM
jgi:hypothetical protein